MTTSDDGINGTSGASGEGGMSADGNVLVTITGGSTVLRTEGDGFDSNGSAVMTGGSLTVWGPTADNNAALDFNGTFTVSGGTLVAAGSAGMAQSPGADSAQGFVAFSFGGTLAAGTQVAITDSSGAVIDTVTLEKATATLVYSSSAIASGASYSAGGVTANANTALAGMGGGGGRR